MNTSSAQHNLESLTLIAHRLDELCSEVTFVGGCITGLLITDPAAPDVRVTVDVDCIINVITTPDYYAISKKLRQKGFKEMIAGDHPMCRWDCDGILVDVMPINENVLGFSNLWYPDAQSNSIEQKITDTLCIKIISAPYFLATKLEAFKDRGKQDFLSSHDLEDIISLINGRSEIVHDISIAPDNLKQYLSFEFALLMHKDSFLQALPGHLNDSDDSDSRLNIVKARILAIIDLGK